MIYNITSSMIFVAILSWIYDAEIVHYWSYLRFEGSLDPSVVIELIIGVLVLSFMLPSKKDARSYILAISHFFFFLPSLVYISFSDFNLEHYVSFYLCTFIVYAGSALPLRAFKVKPLRQNQTFLLLFVLMSSAVLLQAAFGGLSSFNLNLEDVYKYRSSTAAKLPSIFGYLYSNVANTIIPGSIVLALSFKQYSLAFFSFFLGVLLFAMAHHKSILFTTAMVFFIYWIIDRYRTHKIIAVFPILIVIVCGLDVLRITYLHDANSPSIISSYLVRRALMVPPMLDAGSIELFSGAPKYLWSTSRFGLGIADNPYGLTAPFFMGEQLFQDPAMSANQGLIGSGYYNAGIVGVIIYSVIISAIISYINTIGKKVNPELIAAMSFSSLLIIFTSTDLTTALLTHGLLLLLILISFLPRRPTPIADDIKVPNP